MSHSMMDSVDVRIEGMEAAMQRLQNTIKRLTRKVTNISRIRPIVWILAVRRGRNCVIVALFVKTFGHTGARTQDIRVISTTL